MLSMSMLSSSSCSLCQGVPSCLEPQQPHPSKTMPEIHNWVRPSSTHHEPVTIKNENEKEMDSGSGAGSSDDGWSSICSLSSPSKTLLEPKSSSPPPATIYTKRSMLAKKNLATCTETLGCETGAVYVSDEFDAENRHSRRASETKGIMMEKRRSKRGSSMGAGFPPPLTTLSGESRLRVMSKRENGRLLLLPVKPSVIEAERTDGRLLLRLFSDKPFHSNDTQVEELDKEEVKEEEEKEEVMKEESEEEGGYLGVVGVEMNEMNYNGINGEEEMEIGKFRRPGGCKEEEGGGCRSGTSRGKPMLNWEAEAFWVASS